MAGVGVPLVADELRRQRLDELLDPGDRRRRVVLSGEHEHGALDALRVHADVEIPRAGRVPVRRQRQVHLDPRDCIGRQRRARVQRNADAHELGEVELRRIGEVAGRDLSGLRPAEAVELRDRARVAVAGDGADEHEPVDEVRASGRMLDRDHAADPGAEQDRPQQLELLAERGQVGGPRVERPVLRRAPIAASRAAHVEVDHLHVLGERRPEVVLVQRMIHPRTGRKQDHCRAVAHPGAVRPDLGALDVEEELDPVDGDFHVRVSSAWMSSRKILMSS